MKHRKLLLILTSTLLMLALGSFISYAGNQVDVETVKVQLDEYIKEIKADGTLEEMRVYWLEDAESDKSIDYSQLTTENGTLILGTMTQEPFSYILNGQRVGYAIDILYSFCKKYGYGLECYDYGTSSGIIAALQMNKVDVGGGNTSVRPERAKQVDFTETYYDNQCVVVTTAENSRYYNSEEDLNGKIVATLTGCSIPDRIKEVVPDCEVLEYNTVADMCVALESKLVDAAVYDYAVLQIAMRSYDDIVVACDFGEPDTFAFFFKKSIAANEDTGFFESIEASFRRNFVENERYKLISEGILTTLLITIFSIVIGTVLGFIVFLTTKPGNIIVRIMDWLINGLPTVVLLMILYYIVFGKTGFNGTIISIIGFTLIFASSTLGLLRTSVGAIDPGQFEVSYALGFTKNQTFFDMILPQALQIAWPGYKSAIIAQIKATSIVGYIAVQDITKAGDMIRSSTFDAFLPLIVVALIYFLLAWILTRIVDHISKLIGRSPEKTEKFLKGVDIHD